MPINPTALIVLQALRKQLRYTYMFVPISIYLLLLIAYPVLQPYLMREDQIVCDLKTQLVQWDEFLFMPIYEIVRESYNRLLITICAVPYLMHFGSPAFYLLYLIIKLPGWKYFWLYVLSLGLTSSISIILQYFFPTAPPWIFAELPAEAKFYLVDELISINIFHGIYGLNKLVCGAFPSIHVQWPSIIAFNGAVHPCFGATYVLWITTAAVYSEHHWISDVLIGMIIAGFSSFIAKLYISRVDFEPIVEQAGLIIMETDVGIHSTQFLANSKV